MRAVIRIASVLPVAAPPCKHAIRSMRSDLPRAFATQAARSDSVDIVDPTIGLSDDARALYEVAASFAAGELAPHAAEWDAKSHFPEDALRAAAALGFGGLYVRTESGGSGISRQDSMPIIEALAGADTSTTAYLTIHNMCAW